MMHGPEDPGFMGANVFKIMLHLVNIVGERFSCCWQEKGLNSSLELSNSASLEELYIRLLEFKG